MNEKLNIDFNRGDIIDNEKIKEVFKCSGQGGMRRSKKTGTLVIVSNHVRSLYGDQWEGDVLHYIGMGRKGDQSFHYMQNKSLYYSNSNEIEVHLFEVFRKKEYTYQGRVQLVGEPYMKLELDEENQMRDVCVFPVGLIDDKQVKVEEETLKQLEDKAIREASKFSQKELYKRANTSVGKPGFRKTEITHYQRNPYVVQYAKKWANGICQLCDKPAPFQSRDGTPYLETHHIDWLSRGGEDTIKNTIALCPNCHRKMHVLEQESDVLYLKNKVEENEV
ncbi:HNH endonuclease [Salimicrobium jeotgali]|uniref:HNH endonuclease n=1 Tax=Salimicrobium jeotgali TaxID=1230341 RepID=UPI000C840A9F|nr:HNH endonuclease [Salimicrobium jeotgali]